MYVRQNYGNVQLRLYQLFRMQLTQLIYLCVSYFVRPSWCVQTQVEFAAMQQMVVAPEQQAGEDNEGIN